MKKLLILMLIIIAGCAKQPVYKASRAPSLTLQDINIGTSPNDGTGDPLRTAFGKVNTNNIALRNLASSIYTQTEVDNLLNLKAPLASPQFSGTPRISTDTVATRAYARIFGGGATVTARGVCWATTLNPTVSDSHTLNGTGNGTFTSSITGLSPETTYYVRAYATNSAGTSYGSEVSFITLEATILEWEGIVIYENQFVIHNNEIVILP